LDHWRAEEYQDVNYAPIKRQIFQVGRLQLTNPISYLFNESLTEETRSLNTSCADDLYGLSEILNVTEELRGEIEIFHTDSLDSRSTRKKIM